MPNGYGPYVGPGPSGYYGGYPPPGVYGGYPPPGYYGSAQAQALGALAQQFGLCGVQLVQQFGDQGFRRLLGLRRGRR